MVKILFVCHGNICRSPMAEFIAKYQLAKLNGNAIIDSKATSSEEEGNPVYYAIRPYLDRLGIDYSKKRAHKMTRSDGDYYDYIICMEEYNVTRIKAIIDKQNYNKIYKLLDFTPNPQDIDDPWYTRDFDLCYEQIFNGVTAFLDFLAKTPQPL